MKILIYFILCSINVVAYNEIKPGPFKVLFRMDALARMINGRSYEIKSLENGMRFLTLEKILKFKNIYDPARRYLGESCFLFFIDLLGK